MFESVELGQKVGKKEFEKEALELRTRLIKAQYNLKNFNGPVILIISGLDGAGKGDLGNFLSEQIDVRYLKIATFWDETDEQTKRPYYWRYWNSLPERGKVGFFYGAWYTDPVLQNVRGDIDEAEFERRMKRVSFLERTLANDGALILKFWLHVSKDFQKQKIKGLENKFKGSKAIVERGMWHYNKHDKMVTSAETAIRNTDNAFARWFLVEAEDKRHCHLKVARILTDALEAAGEGKIFAHDTPSPTVEIDTKPAPVLEHVDLNKTITQDNYKKKVKKLGAEISQITWEAYKKGISSVALFEGWDAAGKGGAIRRLTQAIDTRLINVISVAAPTDEEKARHYLWRFWRHIPRAGYVTVYDRSWYGRVLVERVEGFADAASWSRSYEEINDFEQQLKEAGTAVMKFWVHISKDEQMRRFKEREQIPWKQHKITEEDYRNREKWDDYLVAGNEMISRTSTSHAKWHIIEGDDKKYARVKVMETYLDTMSKIIK